MKQKDKIFYKPKEERIGLDIAPKDDGWDVEYKPESRKKRIGERIKLILFIIFISFFVGFLLWYFADELMEKTWNKVFFLILFFIIGYLVGTTEEEHRQTLFFIKRGWEYDYQFNEWKKIKSKINRTKVENLIEKG